MFEKISKLSLKAISMCNLNCIYCHQLRDDKRVSNSFNKFKELKNFLLSIPLDEHVDITVTGGEITLRPDIFNLVIKTLKKVERQIDVKFDVCIATNGTNMNMIYEWCDKGLVCPSKVSISWDGIYSASKSRFTGGKYTDDFFKNVIIELGKSKYSKEICISHAITPSTIDYLTESFDFCLSNNVFNIGYYFIHEANYEHIKEQFSKQIENIAKLVVKNINLNKEVNYYNWQLIYSRRKHSENFFLCNKLGKNYHIDTDGSIYPCIYFGDHRALKFGDLNSGLNENIIHLFSKVASKKPNCNCDKCNNVQCSECPASNFVHNKSINERFCNLCNLLPIETEIYDRYVPKLNNIYKESLYIPNDISVQETTLTTDENMILLDNDSIISPTYNGVRKW